MGTGCLASGSNGVARVSAERDLQRIAADVHKAVAKGRRDAGLAMKKVAAVSLRPPGMGDHTAST
jgi:hypothetical protein